MEIRLSSGKITLIDDIDSDLAVYRWCYGGGGYALRGENNTTLYLHRVIMGRMGNVPQGYTVDHINRDKLDNRRENLRVATASQNHINSGLRSDNTSGFKGVYWRKDSGKWRAKIRIGGKYINMGSYETVEEAHEVYKKKELETFGEFSVFSVN